MIKARIALSVIMLSGIVFAQDSGAALERLARVDTFAFGPVGYAGATSKGETDYKTVMSQSPTAALAALEKLYANGNAQAKCYALAGIRKLAPKRFRELLDAIRDSKTEVVTMSGCIVSHETLGVVAQRIADGKERT